LRIFYVRPYANWSEKETNQRAVCYFPKRKTKELHTNFQKETDFIRLISKMTRNPFSNHCSSILLTSPMSQKKKEKKPEIHTIRSPKPLQQQLADLYLVCRVCEYILIYGTQSVRISVLCIAVYGICCSSNSLTYVWNVGWENIFLHTVRRV